jgi:sulfide:quinone oxidoreductase
MELHTPSAELSVAPQILPEDMARIRAAGFQSVICNRPDGEAGDQPLFAEIERRAGTGPAPTTCPPCRAR